MSAARPSAAAGLFLIAAIALKPDDAGAWSTDGHRAICDVAWDELQPAAEREVRSALGISSKVEFAARCEHGEITSADLMSLPQGARDLDLDRDCPPPDSCPVREIALAVNDLENRRGDLAKAILRLARYTGEVHQPLSVGYAVDRNGLDIPADFKGRATSMHTIWNEDLVMAPQPPRPLLDTGFELRLITNYLERSKWAQSEPLAWAGESYWIMRTPATGYVGNPGGLAFDDVYVAQNKITVLDQIEKAGVRLAHLLNRAFGAPGGTVPGDSPGQN